MNYIQLVQDLFAESRAAGTAPSTVVGLTGLQQDMARWIADAWDELAETQQGWLFKKTDVTFSTASLASDYDPTAAPLSLTDFADWVPDTFRVYVTADGVGTEQYVEWMDYPAFRDYWLFNTRRTTSSIPRAVTSAPNKHLLVGPVPDQDYTIVGQYWSKITRLSDDSDEPAMPARFHKLITYRALEYYALAESAPEVLARAERGQARYMLMLTRNQLPTPQIGPPLVG